MITKKLLYDLITIALMLGFLCIPWFVDVLPFGALMTVYFVNWMWMVFAESPSNSGIGLGPDDLFMGLAIIIYALCLLLFFAGFPFTLAPSKFFSLLTLLIWGCCVGWRQQQDK